MAQVNVRNRKRTDGTNNWEYRFEIAKIDGKRKRISKSGFKTKSEAMREGIKAFEEYNNTGQSIKVNNMSVSDFLDYYMENYIKVNVSKRTASNYEYVIRNHIKPIIGKYKLQTMSPEVLIKLLADMSVNGYAHSTLIQVHRLLSASFKYAVYPMGYIKHSPMDYVRVPRKNEEQNERRLSEIKRRDGKKNGSFMGSNPHIYVSNEWMARIFERFPKGHVYYIPLKTGLLLGTRLGETYALTREDFNFEEKTVNVYRQVQWDKDNKTWYLKTPKKSSDRIISISDNYAEIVKDKFAQIDADIEEYGKYYTRYYENENHEITTEKTDKELHFLNVREDGSFVNPRTISTCLEVIHHEMGLKEFDFHSLRHTHATNLAKAGASPKFVQHRLGHKNIQVTLEIYQHLEVEMERKEAELLNRL